MAPGKRLLNETDILRLFAEVDQELHHHNESQIVSLLIVGGAAISLQWKTRMTYDVDVISDNMTPVIRSAVARIADRYGLDRTWMNDAVKISPVSKNIAQSAVELYSGKCLKVYGADARYLLAMKLYSSRAVDKDDVQRLMTVAGISSREELLDLIDEAYPSQVIPVAVQYNIEEALERYTNSITQSRSHSADNIDPIEI